MSDLPSRGEVQVSMDDELGSLGLVYQIADAYVSGRLVDREAIDWEAGLAVARELWTVEPVWDESSFALVFDTALEEA